MTARKRRLTVTVDPDLVAAGNLAVEAGRAESLSGWVNDALGEKAARDTRLQSLALAIADYEAEFGEISDEELASQIRSDREAAVVVRGRGAGGGPRRGRSGKRNLG